MTKETIKNTPEIVDFLLDETVTTDSKIKLHKRLEKICDLAIKALEQEPCEDCISKQVVLEQINCWIGSGEYRYTNATDYLTRRMQGIPPVTPQPKIGRWEWVQYDGNPNIGNWHCTECKNIVIKGVKKEKKGVIFPLYTYCPNCGAKMEEVNK